MSAAQTSGPGPKTRASRSASAGASPPAWPSSTTPPPRESDPARKAKVNRSVPLTHIQGFQQPPDHRAQVVLDGYLRTGYDWSDPPTTTGGPTPSGYRCPGSSVSPEGYYATAFHECGHSTGHQSRPAAQRRGSRSFRQRLLRQRRTGPADDLLVPVHTHRDRHGRRVRQLRQLTKRSLGSPPAERLYCAAVQVLFRHGQPKRSGFSAKIMKVRANGEPLRAVNVMSC